MHPVKPIMLAMLLAVPAMFLPGASESPKKPFFRAMRTGKHFGASRDILPPMPWQALAQLRAEDLRSVFAYLRTVPAVVNRVPEPQGPAGLTHNE
jgi:hypothetical protein